MSESPMSPLVPRARFSEIDQARNETAGEPVLFHALCGGLARGVTSAERSQEAGTEAAQSSDPYRPHCFEATRRKHTRWDAADDPVHVRNVCAVCGCFDAVFCFLKACYAMQATVAPLSPALSSPVASGEPLCTGLAEPFQERSIFRACHLQMFSIHHLDISGQKCSWSV